MPKACEQPYDQDIADLLGKALAVSAQGNIHILLEPAAQRDMPAPPKLRNALRDIGIVKVFKKMEAKHPPQADCHIRITGKIKINLERKGEQTDPCG